MKHLSQILMLGLSRQLPTHNTLLWFYLKENSNDKAAELKNFPLEILTNGHEFVFRIFTSCRKSFSFLFTNGGRWILWSRTGLITSVDDEEQRLYLVHTNRNLQESASSRGWRPFVSGGKKIRIRVFCFLRNHLSVFFSITKVLFIEPSVLCTKTNYLSLGHNYTKPF